MTQPTPSDRFWSNVSDALNDRRRRIVKRVQARQEVSQSSLDQGSDLDLMITAISEGRVTITPRAE